MGVYFGVFYVPSWLRDSQAEKSINAQLSLQQSIKELIYSDSICKPSEVVALIEGKEIALGQPYPYTRKQLLTQVQTSFMQDKFLPLQARRDLVAELESLKAHVPESPLPTQETAKLPGVLWVGWLSIIGSIGLAILGIRSLYLKFRVEKEKDEEIENQIIATESPDVNQLARNYEDQIVNAVRIFPGVEVLRRAPFGQPGFDLEFTFEGKPYFLDVKYLTRSKVGLSSFHGFLARQKGLEGNFWFVYNTDLTEMVRREADKWNKLTGPARRISLIKVETENDFKRQLAHLLRN